MGGPDTFMQTAAAFLDFRDDSDDDTVSPPQSTPSHSSLQTKTVKIYVKREIPWTFNGDPNKRRCTTTESETIQRRPTWSHPLVPPYPIPDLRSFRSFPSTYPYPNVVPYHPTNGTLNRSHGPSKKKQPKSKKREWSSSEETEEEAEPSSISSHSDNDNDSADDHELYGCAMCRYAEKGCDRCRTEEPSVRRPKIVWDPTQPHEQSDIPDGPVFRPTEEEFRDPFRYISTIRSRAEQFGICMIVPPSSWKPPIDPMIHADAYEFYPKRQFISHLCVRGCREERGESTQSGSDEEFGFVSSETPFTFRSFKSFADWAHRLHFNRDLDGGLPDDPSDDQIEGEFWRMVERGDETEFETFYGSDLDASKFREAFVQAFEEKGSYKAMWNVALWPHSSDSVLRFIPGNDLINGVMIPWVYFGSSLSAFCWHIEDHALYSINYLHQGASKIWYGVPSCRVSDFEAAMEDAFPDLFKADRRLLHRLVTHLSPQELKKRGVPVYRLVHRPGSFVITFPNGYHGGFNCGWNCAEAVNFAPPDWLPFGSDILKKYKRQQRPTTFSHDALLLQIMKSLQSPNIDSTAVKFAIGELNLRIRDEIKSRAVARELGIQHVRSVLRSLILKRRQEMRMQGGKDALDDRGMATDAEDKDCEVCKCDLFLSAVVSADDVDVVVCPEHASHLPRERVLLYRYTIKELEAILDAGLKAFPESQSYIDRAIDREMHTSQSTFVKRGPFRGRP